MRVVQAFMVVMALTDTFTHAGKTCNRLTEVKVRNSEVGSQRHLQEPDRSSKWSCVPRHKCDPVFQFTVISTEHQQVCEDFQREEYVLTFDEDLSIMVDVAQWQEYFESTFETFTETERSEDSSAVHVHSCTTEHISDQKKWKAYCSVHFEPTGGEPYADADRDVALAARVQLHAQERQRRGFGSLNGQGSTEKLPTGQKACGNQRCCKVGFGVNVSDQSCIACVAESYEYSDTAAYATTSTDNAALCQSHPTCRDNEGIRWGFYDSDGTTQGTVVTGTGTDTVDRFGSDHFFLTNTARAVCIAKTDCKASELLTQTVASEWEDGECGAAITYCTSKEEWWADSEDTAFLEDDWFTNPTCANLEECEANEWWVNFLDMETKRYTTFPYVYTMDRDCTVRPTCEADEYLSNAQATVTAMDDDGFWKKNNGRENDCSALTVCDPVTQFTRKEPETTKRGQEFSQVASACKDWCSTADDKCSYKICYGCETCIGPEEFTTSQRYCQDATAPCSGTQFEQAPFTATTNRLCTDWEVCEHVQGREYEGRSPNATHDRLCLLTTDCNAATEFEVSPPTEFADRTCQAVKTCDFEVQYEFAAPTLNSDRDCQNLSVCNYELQYESVEADYMTNRICTDLRVCTADQYESMEKSVILDRVCSDKTECDPLEYETVEATPTSDRQCQLTAVAALASVSFKVPFDLDLASVSDADLDTLKADLLTTFATIGGFSADDVERVELYQDGKLFGSADRRQRRATNDPITVTVIFSDTSTVDVEEVVQTTNNQIDAGLQVSATVDGKLITATVTDTATAAVKVTLAPTAAPTATPTASAPLFTIYRPFFGGDSADLVASFDRWDLFPPCALDANTLMPTSEHLPVDMVLYYARNISSDSAVLSTIQGILDTDLSDSAGNGKAWRNCFSKITAIGAHLTPEEDQYHTDMEDPTWNLGPNMQFYKLLRHISDSDSDVSKVFYYMEGDSIPVKASWLDALADEINAVQPFDVLGGRYQGHNWNTFTNDIIEPALENHLNGNGVYNVSSTLTQRALKLYEDEGDDFATNFHASFDVYLCMLLMDVDNHAKTELEAQGYVSSSIISNFATTLTLPQNIPSTTQLIHGAVYVHNWPSESCNRNYVQGPLDAWYPGLTLESADKTSMSLVVSDFADGKLDTFMQALGESRETIRSAIDGSCSGTDGEVLPFRNTIIVTNNDTFESTYSTAYGNANTEVHARDWTVGASAWWDLCTAPVETDWFMLVTSYFELPDDFALPIDVEAGTGALKALAPFLEYGSAHCGRECRQSIEAGRVIEPTFNRHFGQEYAVFNTEVRDKYCNFIQASSSISIEPSIDGYFAYIKMLDPASQAVDKCNEIEEEHWCSEFSTIADCGRDDETGDHVRSSCPTTCGTCGVNGNINDNDPDIFLWHDQQVNNAWWDRKTSSESYGSSLYTMYNREKLFVVHSFNGEDSSDTTRCENLEFSASNNDTYSECPCVFPFYYKGFVYDACTTDANSLIADTAALWCPTSTSNTGEFLDGSRDLRLCVAGDGGNRARRGGEFKPELNSNALLKSVRKARNATHYSVEPSTTNTGAVLELDVDSGTATATSDFTDLQITDIGTAIVNQVVALCTSGCFEQSDVDSIVVSLGARRARMRRGTMSVEILLNKDVALSKVQAVADAVLTCTATNECSTFSIGSYTLQVQGVTEVQEQAVYPTCVSGSTNAAYTCTGSYQDKSSVPTESCIGLACTDDECCDRRATCTDLDRDGINEGGTDDYVCTSGAYQLQNPLPNGDCGDTSCDDTDCCERQATCTDLDRDGTADGTGGDTYACATAGFQLKASFPADCGDTSCDDTDCCEQKATCSDSAADNSNVLYSCSTGFTIQNPLPNGDCGGTSCGDTDCCDTNARCATFDGTVLFSDSNCDTGYTVITVNPPSGLCSGSTCTSTECCTLQAACADANADGSTGDNYVCADSGYQLVSSFAGITCSGSACTDGECCELLPTCADSNADGNAADTVVCGSGYLIKDVLPTSSCETNPCTDEECCDQTTTTTVTSTTTTAYPKCPAGQFRSTSDPFAVGTCTECADGSYSTIDTYDTECTAYGQCAGGMYRPGAADDPETHKACQSCPDGTYKTGNGDWDATCTAHTTATECFDADKWVNEGLESTVDAQTNRVCQTFTDCIDGSTWQRAAPTPSTDRVCDEVSAACDANHNTNPQYESVPPTILVNRVCKSYIASCKLYESYETTARTPSSDRVCGPVDRCAATDYGNKETWMSALPTLTANTGCSIKSQCENEVGNLSTQKVVKPSDASLSFIFDATDNDIADGGIHTADNTCATREVCVADFQYILNEDFFGTTCEDFAKEVKFKMFNTVYKDIASFQTPEAADSTGRMAAIRTASGNTCPDLGSDSIGDCVATINTYFNTNNVDLAWDDYGSSSDDPRGYNGFEGDVTTYDTKEGGHFYADADFAKARESNCGFHISSVTTAYFPPTTDWNAVFGETYDGKAYHVRYDVVFPHKFDAATNKLLAAGTSRTCTTRRRQRKRTRRQNFGGGQPTSCASLATGEERCSGSGCGKVCCKVGYGSNDDGDGCLDCGGSAFSSGEYYSDESLFRDSADHLSGTVYGCKVQPNACGAIPDETMYKSTATSTTQLLANRCDDLTNCQLEQNKLTEASPASDYADRTCGADLTYCDSAANGATTYWANYFTEGSYSTNEWKVQPTCTALLVCTAGSTYWSNRGSMRAHSPLGSWLDNRVCSSRTACASTEFISNAAQQTGDNNEVNNVCEDLVACTTSLEFEQVAPTLSSQRLCKTAEVCSSDQYETTALTESADRVCAALSTCTESTQWESQEKTDSADRVCSPVTDCIPNQQFETAAPTSTTDRVCTQTTTSTSTSTSTVPAPAGSWVFDPTKTCASHCDGFASHAAEKLTATGWKEAACYCDNYCKNHGDCCDDIKTVCEYDRTTAAPVGETTTFTDTTYTHTSTTVTVAGTTHTHEYGREHPDAAPSEEHQGHWAHEGPAKQQDPGASAHSNDRSRRSKKQHRRNNRKNQQP